MVILALLFSGQLLQMTERVQCDCRLYPYRENEPTRDAKGITGGPPEIFILTNISG